MAKTGVLTVRILSDTKQAEAGLKQFENRVQSTGQKLESAGKKMTVFATLPIAAAMGAATKAASDLNETVSKSNTVFGDAAGEVEAWGDTAAKSIGQSKREALDAASTFGNLFVQLGVGSDQAADMSIAMTELASDFASFHNADITEVINAQSAAFRGEYDALQRFVPTINAAAVEQKALEQTGKAATKELTAQEKALAVQTLMLEGAGDAAGDFSRTQDSVANQTRIAKAAMEDASAEIGQALLPLVAKAAGGVADLAQNFTDLPKPIQNGVLVLAGLTAAIGPALVAFGKISSALTSIRTDSPRAWSAIGKGGAVIAGVGAAFGAAQLLTDAFNDSAERTAEVLSDVAGQSTRNLVDAFASLEIGARGVTAESKRTEAQFAFFRDVAEQNVATARRLRDALVEEGVSASALDGILRDVADAAARAEADQRAAAEATGDLGDASGDGVPVLGRLTDAIGASADKARDAAEAQREHEEAIKALIDAQRAAISPLFAAQDALVDHQKAQQAVTDAEWAIIAAMAERKEAIKDHGEASDEAREADEKLHTAQRDLDDANREVARSALDVAGATLELKGKMDDGSVSIDGARAMLHQWVDQGLLTEQQAEKTAEDLGLVAVAAREADDISVLIPVGMDKSAFDASFANLSAQLDELDSRAIVSLIKQDEALKNRRRHTGGPMRANEGYIVRGGEQVVETQRPAHVFTPGQQQTRDAGQPVSLGPFNFYYASGPSSPSESAATAARKARFVAGV